MIKLRNDTRQRRVRSSVYIQQRTRVVLQFVYSVSFIKVTVVVVDVCCLTRCMLHPFYSTRDRDDVFPSVLGTQSSTILVLLRTTRNKKDPFPGTGFDLFDGHHPIIIILRSISADQNQTANRSPTKEGSNRNTDGCPIPNLLLLRTVLPLYIPKQRRATGVSLALITFSQKKSFSIIHNMKLAAALLLPSLAWAFVTPSRMAASRPVVPLNMAEGDEEGPILNKYSRYGIDVYKIIP